MSRGEVLDWIRDPSPTKGVYALVKGDWEFRSYRDLGNRSCRFAARLIELSAEAKNVVLALPGGHDFITSFYGALVAGAIPAPLNPPRDRTLSDRYAQRVEPILRAAAPQIVVTAPPYVDALRELVKRVGSAAHVVTPDPGETMLGPDQWRPLASLALLQFTSGSSGCPRGVRITPANLMSNVWGIADWLDAGADDALASWLPVHHDMGLVGLLLTSITWKVDLWLTQPIDFLLNPLQWLSRFGEGHTTITAMPSFGLDYIVRRLKPEDLRGMDFSGWRHAVIGAERVVPGTLETFARMLEPAGFRWRTYRPAYGLAEATLAVTGHPDKVPKMVRISKESLRFGEPVAVLSSAELGTTELDALPGVWVVSCGTPIAETTVTTVNEAGQALPESHLGEFVVRGPSVADGYQESPYDNAASARFLRGAIATGDAGFFIDGEIYVLGRMGDSCKLRGQTIYVEDLECAMFGLLDAPPNRSVILAGVSGAAPTFLYLTLNPDPDVAARVAGLIREHIGRGAVIRVLLVSRNGLDAILRTSSGKPRRREMWQRYLKGSLNGRLLAELSDPPGM